MNDENEGRESRGPDFSDIITMIRTAEKLLRNPMSTKTSEMARVLLRWAAEQLQEEASK